MPSQILLDRGAARIRFKAAGGEATFAPASQGAGVLYMSDRVDRGAGDVPADYEGWCSAKGATAEPVGAPIVTVYLAEWNEDGTVAEGDLTGTTAGTQTANKRHNLTPLAQIASWDGGTSQKATAHFRVQLTSRYFAILYYIHVTLTATAADHEAELKPVVAEGQ